MQLYLLLPNNFLAYNLCSPLCPVFGIPFIEIVLNHVRFHDVQPSLLGLAAGSQLNY